ncbi:hypothetical protein JEQ12_013234 [Ovis aries]|uniref:Uncharacterized protein n=1 Tax=Ovis aries TaxID=9940 RepID=A0A835ZMB4_SHEEP|nr:hypothetical protein JEQ12_013234 [Ovis aries]
MLAAPWPGWAIRRESHRVWLPPSAKRTDLLPALRTNPLPEPLRLSPLEKTSRKAALPWGTEVGMEPRALDTAPSSTSHSQARDKIEGNANANAEWLKGQCKAASGLFCSSPLGSTVARAARCPLPRAAGSSKDDPELRGWLYGFKARRHHPRKGGKEEGHHQDEKEEQAVDTALTSVVLLR